MSNALSLPDFNHHRAADDAMTCGLIMAKLMVKLEEEHDIHNLQAINPAMTHLRSGGRITDRQARHIIIFAKNQMGLRNLYHLISDSNLQYFRRVPRMPKSDILKLREGLIIGSACEAGELFQAIRRPEKRRRAEAHCVLLRFSGNPAPGKQPLHAGQGKYEAKSDEELREFNRNIVRLGEELGKPVVATGDVHFLNPEDEIYRHILLADQGL